jgi:alginate O-acetyltransferase complex protein AlgI
VLFTSFHFIFEFLPFTFGVYFLLRRLGWVHAGFAFLFLASLFFYVYWRIQDLPILFGSIVTNYLFGYVIYFKKRYRRVLLASAVSANLALLCYFKYTGFLLTNLNHLVGAGPSDWSVVLPLGISFFTFTQIAYLVDCARGMRGKHNFLDYALFVSFFPHLLAGPIIHHSELIPQFVSTKKHIILLQDVTVGALVFVIGLAKKIILADQVAPITNTVFSHADAGHSLSFFSAWIGAVAFTMQIYFDFSGYSDMAVGVARMFGIRFPWNFDSPYRSTTIVEFWRRWHMTLSRWLRDYLYFPLGGNRLGEARRQFNLLVTMLLGGLWHGANWNFVIWGGIHGAFLIITHVTKDAFFRSTNFGVIGRLIGWSTTFGIVMLAWIFFRATTLSGATHMLESCLGLSDGDTIPLTTMTSTAILLGVALLIVCLLPNSIAICHLLDTGRIAPIPLGLALGALGVLLLIANADLAISPFLYFNF